LTRTPILASSTSADPDVDTFASLRIGLARQG
jgi:hypothetical protein